jgi:hypothetical protein
MEGRKRMTKEKALITALKIIDTCKSYGNEDRCTQCPFNINGCIISGGDEIPAEWKAASFVDIIEHSN